jgi:hypothetical protein
MSVPPGYCIRLRTELASERQNLVTAGTTTPAREAVLPPLQEKVDPRFVVWERYFNLHLLPACHASMECPAMIENALDHSMVILINRPCKFTPYQIVRKVAEKPEVREAIKQVERKK